MKSGLSIREALNTILDSISPLGQVELGLHEAAGYVLAEDVLALDDVPFTDNSAMDGYAIRAVDVETAAPHSPAILHVTGTVAAGPATSGLGVGQGTTLKIMTGATIPSGADTVVPVEEVTVQDGSAHFTEPVTPGAHIRRAGEDMKAGAIVLARGTELTPGALAAAVAAGRASVTVIKRPIVAIFTSGDELLEPGKPIAPGMVRNSNSIALAAFLQAAGCDVVDLGIARDDRIEIGEGLETARRADLLITTGGVSMGDKDLMRAVLEERGLKVKFWRINIKPGKPVLFGMLGAVPVFGLPGNPVSAQVTFEIFVRPALRKMMGHRRLFRPVVPVVAGWEARHSPGRPEFLRVKLGRDGGRYIARPTSASQGSNIMSSMLDADGLFFLHEETVIVPKDSEAPCILLSGKEEEEFDLGK